MKDIAVDRRLHTRHRASTIVFIRTKSNKTKQCKAVNLSAVGCAIRTESLGLNKNERVTLTFVIRLSSIYKLHKRMATVVYIKKGITGFVMSPYEAPKNE